MTESPEVASPRVVIIGGGIAAIETVLALHDLAGPRLRPTLIAPEPDFVLKPLTVARPFGRGHVDRLPLADVMAEHSGRFVRGTALGVDTEARTVTLATGDEIAYDVLVVALGARAVPAFEHAVTFGADPPDLAGILADLEQGWSRSTAFVVPPACTWPLPLYEIALMTAQQVWSMNIDLIELHLVTPEREPLEIFGAQASAAVAELLAARGITTHHDVRAQINRGGRIETGCGPDIVVDRIVALPDLEGISLDGLPADDHGFVPVDDAGLVDGLDGVYAVGDVTDRPIKQGGLACQQADATAAHIAARAGAPVDAAPLRQELRGRLLTGSSDRFLRREAGETQGATDALLWWPAKVSGRYLSPYLVAKGLVHLPSRSDPRGQGIDVHVPLAREQRHAHPEILG